MLATLEDSTTESMLEKSAPQMISSRFFLDDPATMWMVENGFVDLFAVLGSGVRRHIMRVEAGETLFGMPAVPDNAIRLMASSAPEALVRCLPVPSFPDSVLLGAWTSKLAAASSVDPAAIDSGLLDFHHDVLINLERQIRESEESHRERLRARARSEASQMNSALSGLATSVDGTRLLVPENDGRSRLLLAFDAVAKAMGVSIAMEAPLGAANGPSEDPLNDMESAAGLRSRKVTLSGAWWKHDAGPLIGSISGNHVALIPGVRGYSLFDPSTGRTCRVTSQVAAGLDPGARSFYRPLPQSGVTPLGLLWFGFRQCYTDLLRIALLGFASGLLGLAAPVITGELVGFVIPNAERSEAVFLAGLLALCSLCSGLFAYASAIALQRTGGRTGAVIMYALWDRLLSLPPSFFKKYASGDLSLRLATVDQVRQTLTGPLISGALGCPFAGLQILLLFHYSPAMAVPALFLATALVTLSVGCGLLLIRRSRAAAAQEGAISGKVFELLSGIAKIRVAAAETRAFASWARLFGRHRLTSVRSKNISAVISVSQAVTPLLGWALVVLFSGVAQGQLQGVGNVGALLAFSMALQQILAAAVQLSSLLSGVAQMMPLVERVLPILDASPEYSPGKIKPGSLSGRIEVQNLTFQYQPDRPVLRGLSFQIEPGQFIGLVGASGSGKSTLFRLLLGFERPTGGSILYDGHEIGALDLASLRRQMGVVLQDGHILEGDIGSNILGASTLSLDAAWEAARLAGLESDIQAMPMQMHTRLTNGQGGLSGGQRQRLLIARALVNKPRILLFDEATSALDNRTQAIVSASLESLRTTRVVIAHRLSTIRKADRIFVLEDGMIVESGTFDGLMDQRGRFYEFAKRQVS